MSKNVFEEVNGMSNHYWGWGLEDEEFEANIRNHGFFIHRPILITESQEDTFIFVHSPKQEHDVFGCHQNLNNKTEDDIDVRSANDGLNMTEFKILNAEELKVDDVMVTVINVDVECDKEVTPWCECTTEPEQNQQN